MFAPLRTIWWRLRRRGRVLSCAVVLVCASANVAVAADEQVIPNVPNIEERNRELKLVLAEFEEASRLFKSGKRTEGIELWSKALATLEETEGPRDESSVHCRILLGRLHSLDGDVLAARACYATGIERAGDQKKVSRDKLYALVDLGKILLSLQDFGEAAGVLQEAARLKLEVFKERDLDAAAVLYTLSIAYRNQEALAYEHGALQQAVEIYRQSGKSNDLFALEITANLARTSRDLGQIEHAIGLYSQALKHCEAAHGPQHGFVAEIHSQLALTHAAAANQEIAQAELLKALEIYERQPAEQPVYLVRTLDRLAKNSTNLSRLDDAERFARRSLELAQGSEPRIPEFVGAAELTLALVLAERNKLADARTYLEQAEQTLRPIATSHPLLWLDYMEGAASVERTAGNYRSAEQRIQEALTILRNNNSPRRRTGMCLYHLAMVQMILGEFSDSLKRLDEATTLLRDIPAATKDLGSIDILRASIYSRSGHAADAEELLITTLSNIPDDPSSARDRARALIELGRLNQRKGSLDIAKEQLLEAIKIQEEFDAARHARAAEAHDWLGETYRAEKDFSQARRHLNLGREIRAEGLNESHPDMADSLLHLGLLAQDQGDSQAAAVLIAKSVAIYSKSLGAEHPEAVAAQRKLAELGSE